MERGSHFDDRASTSHRLARSRAVRNLKIGRAASTKSAISSGKSVAVAGGRCFGLLGPESNAFKSLISFPPESDERLAEQKARLLQSKVLRSLGCADPEIDVLL
jgi:hypothetical protein